MALAIVAFVFVAYAVLHLNERPGLFAGVAVNSYALSVHFGSLGAISGIVAILAGLSGWTRYGSIKPPEILFLAWIVVSLLTVPFSPQIEIASNYGAALVFLSASGFVFGRATGAAPGFMRDLPRKLCVRHLSA